MPSFFRRCIRKLQRTLGLGESVIGEIKDDALYHAIQRFARERKARAILEIGSSVGSGSTEAFVRGIRETSDRPTLFCMEVRTERFEQLQQRYRDDPFVRCYNVSSVPPERFLSEDAVRAFYRVMPWRRGFAPTETVVGWLRSELDYLRTSKLPSDGIRLIKRENDIAAFDIVLIDGSDFAAPAELEEVLGAPLILLDDINTLKNHHNCLRLIADPRYELVETNVLLRNGYAIFERRKNDAT